jgi:GT2 family glycosyltransferase
MVSIVVPVHNGERTLDECLSAACAAAPPPDEVIVVDDGSTDASASIASRYCCRLVRLAGRSGAAAARNAGARAACGDVLFFIDADCMLSPGMPSLAAAALQRAGARAVVGGTYDRHPFDPGFFPAFQAVFVNYHETRRLEGPDYVATHAMVIRADDFRESGGFDESFLPILEDVEFSHRLRRAGYRLRVEPGLLVRHSFGFDLRGSLRNAARKVRYWTRYSARNRDVLADSGTASRGLKAACIAHGLGLLCTAAAGFLRMPALLCAVPVLALGALGANAGLVRAFFAAGGAGFGTAATLYYFLVYPFAIAAGAAGGIADLARCAGK